MGFCRLLVYVTAAYAFAADPPQRVFAMGFLLLCYLIGLTYIAKQEHLERVANLWPLAFLAAPLLWGLQASLTDAVVAGIGLLFLLWVLYSLAFLRRRRPGDVPRAVGESPRGDLPVGRAGAGGRRRGRRLQRSRLFFFGLTLLLQRYVSPT